MSQIAVLYDGHCGLCLRSMKWLARLDWLHHLSLVNFHDQELRESIAPECTFEDLNKAMHVCFADGRTFKGFRGLRAVCWHLPSLFWIAPLLYLPGISHAGDFVYKRIAEKRKKCSHERCTT